MINITAILNVHSEGVLAHASMLSIREARRVAEAAGLQVEVIVVADTPNAATRAYVEALEDAHVLTVEVRDLGLARNRGVEVAQGHYIAFLDGDDLWGPNWLLAAYKAANAETRRTIWHPEGNLIFGTGTQPVWMIHPDIEEIGGDWVILGVRNHWTALSFAAREIYRQTPYRRVDLKMGLGYEDWSWNEETIAQGCLHKPVMGTAHMVRVRQNSLVRQTASVGAVKVPSTLFVNRIGWKARAA